MNEKRNEEREELLDQKRGSGVEPIPSPDSRQADAEGSTGQIDEAVAGMMDQIEESLFGTSDDRKANDEKKRK